MKKIIFLLFSLLICSLFSSCNSTRRAEKRIYNTIIKNPELVKKDTVKIDTTLVVVPSDDSVTFRMEEITEEPKLLLSQLSPELGNYPTALRAMGDNIATLSKTMGGDATAAAEVLTTAMNQYGISMDDSMEASSLLIARSPNALGIGAASFAR